MRAIFIALISIIISQGLYAQAGAFVNINSDAKSLSMGGVTVTLPANGSYFWHNSAASSFSEETVSVATSYGLWQPDFDNGRIFSASGFAKVSERITINAGFKNYIGGAYDIFDNNGTISGTFTPKDQLIGAGVGVKVLDNLSLGANFNYITSDIGGPQSAGTVGIDFGAYLMLNSFQFGLTASNFGGKINYGGSESYNLPSVIKLGVSTSTTVLNDNFDLTSYIQGEYHLEESSIGGSIGVEYAYKKIVGLRIGANFGGPSGTYTSAGLGFNYLGFNLSAAYLYGNSVLNKTLMLTLGYSF